LQEELAMKSRLYRLTVLILVLGVLPLNIAIADEIATREFTINRVSVSYNLLDLTDPTELANVYARIKSAARKVCGMNIRVSLNVMRRNRECASHAIEDAIGEIDDARLTAFRQSILTETRQS
jgi:UrcA family protein